MINWTAPAKVNLYLHVGSVRRDGLHDLASLFVFAQHGDVISVEAAPSLSLDVVGPYAAALSGAPVEDNLVYRAARRLAQVAGVKAGAAIRLQKNLPVAAGVGGGSADAAAALRALAQCWRIQMSETAMMQLAFSLGADVPACLAHKPVTVTGAGEIVAPGPALPPLWICLVNPRVAMPTGPIFRDFDAAHPKRGPGAINTVDIPMRGVDALRKGLALARNDLQPYAVARAPVIGAVIEMLSASPGALIARMSGSGATCFALFASAAAAARAARRAHGHGWWAMASGLHVR